MQSTNLIVIDPTIPNYQTLLQDLPPNSHILYLNPQLDSIDQITSTLSQLGSVSSLHILAHGSPGQIDLAATAINSSNVDRLQQWQPYFTDSADLLLYSCNLTTDGNTLVERIAQITGADVAASDDPTGATILGGDWELETQIGNIETPILPSAAARAAFGQLLATFTVTNTNDGGAGSLRQALIDANNTPGKDTISFASNVTGTINLNSQLVINQDLTLQGPGKDALTLNAQNKDYRVLEIQGNPTVEISGLTFTGGNNNGGGIRSNGNVTVKDSAIVGNRALASGGGIILNSGSFTLINSLVAKNQNQNGPGAGIGVGLQGVNLTIIDSTIRDNQNDSGEGAGIYVSGLISTSTLNISGSTISGNRNIGAGSFGGGISFGPGSTGTISNTTISGNYAEKGGGGINFDPKTNVIIRNSTIADNTSPNSGGGIRNDGSQVTLESTIVANNTGSGTANDVSGNFTDGGNNLIETTEASGNGFTTNPNDGTIVGKDPNLAPLANNGGPTLTYALQTGSPAIDTGSNSKSFTTDQRGSGFARVNGNAADIGAFEVQTPTPSTPVPFIVTNNSDDTNGNTSSITDLTQNPGADGISLREAILAANNTPGKDTISFNIGSGSPQTITLNSDLPDITDTIIIDGTSQPGISAGTPGIEINGNGKDGLDLLSNSSGSTIQGLAINRTEKDEGIGIGSNNNIITRNFIGTDITGTKALGNVYGVYIYNAASDNIISDNLISGNQFDGVVIGNSGTENNLIQRNYIGTDITGTKALGNQRGVYIHNTASDNIISDNLISGNQGDGVVIVESGTKNNIIQGNKIGTDINGTKALENKYGVYIYSAASDNIIGGSNPGEGNLISGNTFQGVIIADSDTKNNRILGNNIGTDISGTTALGNLGGGVYIYNAASDNIIGGSNPGEGNLISGNQFDGVVIRDSGTKNNIIKGNNIGTDITGKTALGNESSGVYIYSAASDNIIGGSNPGEGNLISGNKFSGVVIVDSDTKNNIIQGNKIGTDINGTKALGNGSDGVYIAKAASDNIIGGSNFGEGNLISGNQFDGVAIVDSDTKNNIIQGNKIGTDINGTKALGNGSDGVYIANAASDNIIGGSNPGEGNIIGGNKFDGIQITDSGTKNNRIQGNLIGSDEFRVLTPAPRNLRYGVSIEKAASDNIIGGSNPGEGNQISGNKVFGVQITGKGTDNNKILGNYIGINKNGILPIGNAAGGVDINLGAKNNTIQANVISANGGSNVRITDIGTNNNKIQGNFIGTNKGGTAVLKDLNGLSASLGTGIEISVGASDNIIGGSNTGEGNVIAGNQRGGIGVEGTSKNNNIQGNSIFDNKGLGIYLESNIITINDPGDADTGSNNLQNRPTFTTVTGNNNQITLAGTLNSTPNGTFTLEFFANTAADPTGSGEGQTFIGRTSVTTDGSGNANFSQTFTVIPGQNYFSATATDASGNTSEFSRTVTYDLAPLLNGGTQISFTPGKAPAVLDPILNITDPDSPNMRGATVRIISPLAGDVLAFTPQTGITGNYDPNTGTLTFTGVAPQASYQQVLRSVTYNNPNATSGKRQIEVQVTDEQGQPSVPLNHQLKILSTANTPPTISGGPNNLNYTEQAPPIPLFPNLQITDPDDTQIQEAVVVIGGLTPGDTLNFTPKAGISGTYDPVTGTIDFTGKASLADYQTLLRSITYSSANQHPGATIPQRLIAVAVEDARGADSTPIIVPVAITATNSPPVLTSSTSRNYQIGGAPVLVDDILGLTDADSPNLTGATVKISSGFTNGDTLTATLTANITQTYDPNTGTLTLTGNASPSDYQQVLQSVTFSSTSTTPGSRTLNFSVTDNTQLVSNSLDSTLNLVANDQAPVLAGQGGGNYTERGTPLAIAPSLSVTDPDDTQLQQAVIAIRKGFTPGDQINFTPTGNITGTYDASKGILTLTGNDSLANYQAVLRSLTYSSTSLHPGVTTLTRTIGIRVRDAQGADSSALSNSISITPVPDASIIKGNNTQTYTPGNPGVVVNPIKTVTHPENTNLTGATVQIATGLTPGDVLTATIPPNSGITQTYNPNTGTLTLTGTASPTQYQQILQTVTYTSTNPTPAATEPNRTISFQVTDQVGLTSQPATNTINIATTDQPATLNGSTTANYRRGGTPVAVMPNVSITDPDSTQFSSAVVYIGSSLTPGDVLSFTPIGNIKGTYDARQGILELHGLDSLANYQAALRSVTFSSTSTNPAARLSSRTIGVRVQDSGGVDSRPLTSTVQVQVPASSLSANLASNGAAVFQLGGGSGASFVKATLVGGDTDTTSEVAFFAVDDDLGTINGLAPGSEGYLAAALSRSTTLLTALADRPNGFEANPTRIFPFSGSGRFGSLLIRNGSLEDALAGRVPASEVILSSNTSVQFKDVQPTGFTASFKDNQSSNDFQAVVLRVELTEQPASPTADLQGQPQAELLDLRSITGNATATFTVTRSAKFDNVIGFYRVANNQGGIDTNNDGVVDLKPGDAGYLEAAVRNRVTGVDLSVGNNQQAVLTGVLPGGSLYAPLIAIKGNFDRLLDSDPNNNPQVYCPFVAGNGDNTDHLRLLGDNLFGFEDKRGGGDRDFNDLVVKVSFA